MAGREDPDAGLHGDESAEAPPVAEAVAGVAVAEWLAAGVDAAAAALTPAESDGDGAARLDLARLPPELPTGDS